MRSFEVQIHLEVDKCNGKLSNEWIFSLPSLWSTSIFFFFGGGDNFVCRTSFFLNSDIVVNVF